MQSEVSISVKSLVKSYKLYKSPSDRLKEVFSIIKKQLHEDFYALKGVDLVVHRGETVGVIGTNGSGKSTLLKIITGVTTPTSGEVVINGKISALLELGAGFNPQYSGMENIYLNGLMMGYTREEMDKKVAGIVEFADIGDFINQPVKSYSSGMFARLAFAVAITVEPDILIVDEALSVGDIFFQNKCYKKMEELRKKNVTILLVSHDLNSISQYCSRVLLLNKGEQIMEGNPKEVIDIYKKLLVGQLEDLTPETVKTVHTSRIKEQEGKLYKSFLEMNPQILQYGNKKAEIYDFGIFDNKGVITSTLEKNTDCTIVMKVNFLEDVIDPIFAFTIKDVKGNEISGTNTMLEKIDFGTVRRGEKITISYSQCITLQGGAYFLSLGCTGFENNGFQVYHRLYDICSITVIAEKNSVGFFDMNSQIEIERE